MLSVFLNWQTHILQSVIAVNIAIKTIPLAQSEDEIQQLIQYIY